MAGKDKADTGKGKAAKSSKAEKKAAKSKNGGLGARAVSGIAGAAAAFAARKIIIFGWTKVTGRKPPEHPEDPQVSLTEALGWAAVLGAGVQAARILATRMTSGHAEGAPALAARVAERAETDGGTD